MQAQWDPDLSLTSTIASPLKQSTFPYLELIRIRQS